MPFVKIVIAMKCDPGGKSCREESLSLVSDWQPLLTAVNQSTSLTIATVLRLSTGLFFGFWTPNISRFFRKFRNFFGVEKKNLPDFFIRN